MPTHGRGEGMRGGGNLREALGSLAPCGALVSLRRLRSNQGEALKPRRDRTFPEGECISGHLSLTFKMGLLRAQLPPFLLFNKTFKKKVNKTQNKFDFYF